MVVALVLLLSAAYGAGAQYLGSLVHHPWGADVASLSAPWLLLAFLAGATQRDPKRAALLGLGATFAALVGYFLLTDSPLEGAQYTLANTHGFLVSNSPVVRRCGPSTCWGTAMPSPTRSTRTPSSSPRSR